MIEGIAKKMDVKLKGTVEYTLTLLNQNKAQSIDLNSMIGLNIHLEFCGQIYCINCHAQTKKSFGGGYCYRCFQILAECDSCIMKPSLCHYHKGTCRDSSWGEANCMISHIVYISLTSDVKVGITRKTQVPTRWIDQGAQKALPIFEVSSRYQSGLLEELISDEISDRTNWRKMLAPKVLDVDLYSVRDEIFQSQGDFIDEIEDKFPRGEIKALENEKELFIEYPHTESPAKMTSLNFEKTPIISGKLMGIKGQYLILDNGVLNIRKFTGYKLKASF